MGRRVGIFACSAAVLGGAVLALGQDKKKDGPKEPRVTMAVPLAVAPGSGVAVKVRGVGLSEATAVRFVDGGPALKAVVRSKGKAEVPQGAEAAAVGDTQVEIELSLPASTPAGPLPLVVVTPAGETKAYELLVVRAEAIVQEKEPNDGFRQAQPVVAPKVVQGSVQGGEDVDVFRFEAKSGQKFVAEVFAARRGSALDSLLTLYDPDNHIVASNDDIDADARGDSALRFTCPSDGAYSLVLADANGRGGAAHPYLLSLKAAE